MARRVDLASHTQADIDLIDAIWAGGGRALVAASWPFPVAETINAQAHVNAGMLFWLVDGNDGFALFLPSVPIPRGPQVGVKGTRIVTGTCFAGTTAGRVRQITSEIVRDGVGLTPGLYWGEGCPDYLSKQIAGRLDAFATSTFDAMVWSEQLGQDVSVRLWVWEVA